MTTDGPLSRTLPSHPPYLLTPATARHAVSVDVTADAGNSVVEMTVHGRWSPELGGQVIGVLRMCLAGPASTLIVDLRDMADRHGVSRRFWIAAAQTARLARSPVELVVCMTARTMLDYRLRHDDGLGPRAFGTVPEARAAAAARLSQHRRLQARLGPDPISVAAARSLVVQACHRWQLPQYLHDACLIVSELTANAVQHAGTDLVVTVSYHGSRLHLAVRDGDSRYPSLTGADDRDEVVLTERGWGLRLVHGLATAWGAIPARGGKVVWATLSPATPVGQRAR